jgi:hypothetical protein
MMSSWSLRWSHRNRRIEEEDEAPVVHTYELDEPTRSYAPTGIHRHSLSSTGPFAIALDLGKLVPGRKI